MPLATLFLYRDVQCTLKVTGTHIVSAHISTIYNTVNTSIVESLKISSTPKGSQIERFPLVLEVPSKKARIVGCTCIQWNL